MLYIKSLAILFVFSVVCFGFETSKSQLEIQTKNTKITKENLKQRLGKMKVTIKKNNGKINPLFLEIKIVSEKRIKKFKLNNEVYELDELLAKLKEVFEYRKENGIFDEKSNEVDLTLTLAARKTDITFYAANKITVEDFENLVDALQKNDFKQINLDFGDK